MLNHYLHDFGVYSALLWSGILLIVIVGVAINLIKHYKQSKVNASFSTGTPAALICWAETPIFSTPPGGFCSLSVIENAIKVTINTNPQATYLLNIDRILKFCFIPDSKPNAPDHILIEYKEEDGSLKLLNFKQTKWVARVNKQVLDKNDLFAFVNTHINRNDNNRTE